jgi:hypothetical protein
VRLLEDLEKYKKNLGQKLEFVNKKVFAKELNGRVVSTGHDIIKQKELAITLSHLSAPLHPIAIS